eukprot:658019-Lingulodinium_polyedra.AAC.1
MQNAMDDLRCPICRTEATGAPVRLPCRHGLAVRCSRGCGETCQHRRWRQIEGRAECGVQRPADAPEAPP